MTLRIEGGGLSISSVIVGGTPGSVLFINASGQLGQDNTNFYWNNTTKSLGIGISPSYKLDISGSAAADTPGVQTGIVSINAIGSIDPSINFGVDGDYGWIQSRSYNDGGLNYSLVLNPSGGGVGIGTISPTARLHLPVGTTSASSAPLKFNTGGVLMTTPEVHAIEVEDNHIYFTIASAPGVSRKELVLANALIGTAELVYGSGAGRITSSGKMTFDNTDGILTVSGGASSANYVFSFDQPSASGNGMYFSLNSASSARVAMRIVDSSLNQIFNLTTDGTLTLRGNLKFATDATYTIGASSANRPLSVYVSDLTATGVVFSGTGTKLTVDATNFVWDDANNRLGIGTNAPAVTLHVVGTTTIGDGTNALLNLGASNITAGAFTNGLDFNFLPAGGIRFIVQGSDGPGFQAFGGTYPSLAGQIYFDFGSVVRSLASRAVFFRDLQAGGATILKIDGSGITVTGSATVSGLTAGRVVFAGTSGLLTTDADFTFATDTLTITKIAATTFTGDVTISTKNIITDTTTGTKIGTGTTQKLGFFNAAPVVQQTDGATLTNNVTVGGTTDTIADFTDLTTYSNDAATIRNDIYQLARKVKILTDALRALGFTS